MCARMRLEGHLCYSGSYAAHHGSQLNRNTQRGGQVNAVCSVGARQRRCFSSGIFTLNKPLKIRLAKPKNLQHPHPKNREKVDSRTRNIPGTGSSVRQIMRQWWCAVSRACVVALAMRLDMLKWWFPRESGDFARIDVRDRWSPFLARDSEHGRV